MSNRQRIASVMVLLALLTLTIATPAYAFDGRGGEKVIIQAGQVINDDLYATASEIVLWRPPTSKVHNDNTSSSEKTRTGMPTKWVALLRQSRCTEA